MGILEGEFVRLRYIRPVDGIGLPWLEILWGEGFIGVLWLSKGWYTHCCRADGDSMRLLHVSRTGLREHVSGVQAAGNLREHDYPFAT